MSDLKLVNYGELNLKLSDYLETDDIILISTKDKGEIVDDILKLVNECSYPDTKIQTLQEENAKLRECVEFYTHEKPREGYGCKKVAGVMSGHRYDIACGACNEENKGKKARETLKELEGVKGE